MVIILTVVTQQHGVQWCSAHCKDDNGNLVFDPTKQCPDCLSTKTGIGAPQSTTLVPLVTDGRVPVLYLIIFILFVLFIIALIMYFRK